MEYSIYYLSEYSGAADLVANGFESLMDAYDYCRKMGYTHDDGYCGGYFIRDSTGQTYEL